jgi:Tfp pilus assembly protein PilO
MQLQNTVHSLTFRKIVKDAPLLTVVGFTCCMVAVFLLYIILPLVTNIKEIRSEYAYYLARISSENGYADIKQNIHAKLDSLKSKATISPVQQDFTGDISSYLENLISIAGKSDIHFVRMQPQEEKVEKDYALHPVLLVLTTTYHELGSFIAAIEKLPQLYHLDRLALDATNDGKCDVKLLLTCMVPLEKRND